MVFASTFSRFLSSSDFNPLPLISDTLRKILPRINHDRAFLIADTSLLKKSGKNFQYIKVLCDFSSNTFLPAHRLLALCPVIGKVTTPIYLQLVFDKKPIDALIQALKSLLPWLTKSFKNPIFLCDAGLTCNRLIDFLLDRDITFACAISQSRVDEYSGTRLMRLSFDVPSVVKLKGVDRKLYAYRIGEGTDKERVVISNKRLSKRRFESYYGRR